MQQLLRDREQREAEIAEERRRKEEEDRKREEEVERRERESRQQMDLLRELVQELHDERERNAERVAREKDAKVAKLTEGDDIEAYLTTFERLMDTAGIPRVRWVSKLAPQLTGKAQQAYAALGADESQDYEVLKRAVLRRYDINEESYRQRLRSIKKAEDESHVELVTRTKDLVSKWSRDCTTTEDLRDLIAKEQLINTLPEEVRISVKERKPRTSLEAGQFADDYVLARWQEEPSKQSIRREDRPKPLRCFTCKKLGHMAKDCTSTSNVKQEAEEAKSTPQKPEKPKKDLRHIQCFNCQEKGHYSSKCPHNALFCMERRIDYTGESKVTIHPKVPVKTGVPTLGLVEGTTVSDILLDTGCSRSVVNEQLVPKGKILQGEAVAIRCAHGGTVVYPIARVDVCIGDQHLTVEAAVSDTLPMSMLLGTDVPEMTKILTQELITQGTQEDVMMVTTRAQARKARGQSTSVPLAQPTAINSTQQISQNEDRISDNETAIFMSHFPDDLFVPGKNRRQLTRAEKRADRQQYRENVQVDDGDSESQHVLDISKEHLKELQDKDSSLYTVRQAASHPNSGGCFYKDGLLYRRWCPAGRDPELMEVEQLVLPVECRQKVMLIAHSIPIAGHLGKAKTAHRILQRFYWPTLFKDVATFCRTCTVCQKSTHQRGRRAPLISLPIIEEPFSRIAMDIVGPVPKSRSGKRYILVICDYGTRYPEAIPLKSIDAECIAEELVVFFSRVGVPKEILTDQGSNFTSQLLTEIYRLLHVHPIRTTPYHPQTDGLVERFNQTLKSMLRKAATQEGKDWDKLLPYLLFAYREVPQLSTGFSPFELLYGRSVRGPLDILKETWEMEKRSKESVISHVLSMRNKMDKMTEIVKENLQLAQVKQKSLYDRGTAVRELVPKDQVLVLLPTSTNKLLAQWQGPYQVIKRLGKVNYVIDMHDRKKRRRVVHINMLKRWHTPIFDGWAENHQVEDEEDIPDWRDRHSQATTPMLGKQLSTNQQHDLQELLKEVSPMFTDKPGRTTLVEHDIVTGSATAVKLPPYRVPHAYRSKVQQELKDMLASGIIEPSTSEWGAPIVVVPKKNGSIRLCVDYRRLNSVSKADAYPMPRIDELIDRLGRAKFISALDLTRGYWQVPVTKQAQEKTAFTSPFGLYQFKVMPFGLQGAPATFQRLMDKVLYDLGDFSAAYLDDVIVFSESWSDHLLHLKAVLQRIGEAGLTINAKKCHLGTTHCLYLGHYVGQGLVSPEEAKLEAIRSLPQPRTKKEIRSFLGLTGYYRRFIPHYASLAAPLTDLTRKAASNKITTWSSECNKSFHRLQDLLCQSPVLHAPEFEKPFILQTDASDRGVGAVLSQLDEKGQEHPVAYYSRKLLPREERYSTVEKECLAIKLGVQNFQVYLAGRPFQIQTDHHSLVWLDRLKDSNPRLSRWSLFLQPFQYDVVHRSGRANGNADTLSRIATNEFVAGEGGRSVVD